MRLRAVSRVGLGGDRILLVAELVAGIGDQLGQRDAHVGFAGRTPCRQELVQAVEQDGAERAVILGQIIDRRRRGQIGRTVGVGGAQSKYGAHSTLKENFTSASCGSKPASTSVTSNGSSLACAGVIHQPQRVRREIAGDAGADDQHVGGIRQRA